MLDFFIVIVSLLCLLAEGIPALQPLKSLRILRVLRPLRLLARDPGMRLIIELLFKVMPSVSNVFGVMLAIQTVFAILGLQLFMGSFGSCTDASITVASECVDPDAGGLGVAHRMLKGGHGGSNVGSNQGTLWLNPSFGSFDSFGSAMLLLYIMSTGDGWEDIMYQGMDAVGEGQAVSRNDFSPSALFFIVWMFFGSFFAVNLFVGTICDNFSKIKNETDGATDTCMMHASNAWHFQRTLHLDGYTTRLSTGPCTTPIPHPSAPLRRHGHHDARAAAVDARDEAGLRQQGSAYPASPQQPISQSRVQAGHVAAVRHGHHDRDHRQRASDGVRLLAARAELLRHGLHPWHDCLLVHLLC